MATVRVVGVDVGARRLDAVAVDGDGRVLEAVAFAAGDVTGLAAWAEGAAAVAVDAPDAWSTAPHANDDALPPKFRSARCAEIALGRRAGIWVPWTTPVEPLAGTWIAVGVSLWAALRTAGHAPTEVYPHAVFRVLNGGRRPGKKQTAEGRRQRAELLRTAGMAARAEATHDVLDATAAALVALHHVRDTAQPITCGHDRSAIWLPAADIGVATTR